MSKKTSRKKSESGTEDKATVTRLVDEIVSGSSPLPDTTHLFSKIRELEDTTADYTAILSKKFSKSTIDEQLFMINHLFVHLKRLSLSESSYQCAEEGDLCSPDTGGYAPLSDQV